MYGEPYSTNWTHLLGVQVHVKRLFPGHISPYVQMDRYTSGVTWCCIARVESQ